MYAFSVCLKYQRVSVTNRRKIALRHLKYHTIMVIMNKLQLWIRGNRSTRWLKKYPTHITSITHAGLECSRAIISAKTEKKPFIADIQMMTPNYPLMKMGEDLKIEAWLLFSLSFWHKIKPPLSCLTVRFCSCCKYIVLTIKYPCLNKSDHLVPAICTKLYLYVHTYWGHTYRIYFPCLC